MDIFCYETEVSCVQKMLSQASDGSCQKEMERFARAIEEISVMNENEDCCVREILMAVMCTTSIDDIICEIPERNIRIVTSQNGSDVSGRHEKGEATLSSVDEAVYNAEWTSKPVYQSTPKNHYQAKRGRTEQIIAYADKEIGRISYKQTPSDQQRKVDQYLVAMAARYIAYSLKRSEVRRWSQERYGRPLALMGSNRRIHAIELKIERASRSLFPVLIEGEFGTEKLGAAISIHACSNRKNGPFIEIDCSNTKTSLADCIIKAKTGSLCLNNVNQLTSANQAFLQSQIHSHLGQWIGSLSAEDARIISTSNENLRKLVQDGRFSPTLYAELSILNFLVPPVRERPNDITTIINNLISDLDMNKSYGFDEEALAVLRSYPWPGNIYEMKTLIASITLVSDGGEVSASDLLAHAPWLHRKVISQRESELIGNSSETDAEGSALLETWLKEFSEQSNDVMAMHDGLRKAIQMLVDHFAEPISLHDLAKVANLSPSHLSYLFRDVAKASFKDIQHCIRIAKAKELLRRERQMPIAEVAATVGYADLSHFERSFRRRVGMRPRDYRRSTEQTSRAD